MVEFNNNIFCCTRDGILAERIDPISQLIKEKFLSNSPNFYINDLSISPLLHTKCHKNLDTDGNISYKGVVSKDKVIKECYF